MDPSRLISDEYKALITKKHDVRPWGGTGASWVPMLTPIIEAYGASFDMPFSVLDYGCGRGTLKPALEKAIPYVWVDEYDPGVRGKDAVPDGRYDYVVCTDVLEHIEEDKIDDVLRHIESLAGRGVFLLIVFTPAKSSLPDGRNTHILIRELQWWERKLKEHFVGFEFEWPERGSGRAAIALKRITNRDE